VRSYLMGERQPMFDLMAWNADSTRMPYRMHSEYLRKLFLANDLAEGRYEVGDRPVALSDIRQGVFVVGTETDHVAPWRSVYKFNLLMDTDVTFLLTNGGHNAGVVSNPGTPGRHFRVATKLAHDRYADPGAWVQRATLREGSWWPEWAKWLTARSGDFVAARMPGRELENAPGSYVLQP
jgi:polyhydroxyalkanoate synthase